MEAENYTILFAPYSLSDEEIAKVIDGVREIGNNVVDDGIVRDYPLQIYDGERWVNYGKNALFILEKGIRSELEDKVKSFADGLEILELPEDKITVVKNKKLARKINEDAAFLEKVEKLASA